MELDKGTFKGNLMFELKINIKKAIENYGMVFVLQAIDNALIDLEISDEEYLKQVDLSVLKDKKDIEIDKSVKNRKLNIIDTAKYYGIEVKKGRSICPFHWGAKNPSSFQYNIKNNTFYCHSCGEKGDMFTFIKKIKEVQDGIKN